MNNIKKLLTAICLLLSCSLFAQNYGEYKLYSSYNFEDGSATDTQGNSAMTLAANASIVNDAERGSVMSFDGSATGYSVMTPPPIVGDTLALSLWFKRSSAGDDGTWKQIFEFYNSVDESNIYLMPTYGYDDTKSGLVCDTRSFNTDIWEPILGKKLNADDTWHHIVVMVKDMQWEYYIDGVLQANKRIFGSLSAQKPTDLYFGLNPFRAEGGNANYRMPCMMDDIRVYHYPLSESQITQIYKGETVTDPVFDTPITFHFNGDLKESDDRINLTGTGYELITDKDRGQAVKLEAGGQLNFSEMIITEGPSTINFLYKKDAFTSADDGKYIYLASNANNSYGLKLKVTDNSAVLVLETVVDGTTTNEKVGNKALNSGAWNAISIFHSPANDGKGAMRIYLNGSQTAAASGVQTYVLGLDKWSIGSTTAAQSAGGIYDELIVEKYAMNTTEISSYYQSNLTSTTIVIDYADTHQTIRNFGASDAWNAQLIGKVWPTAKKERLAELLFSKEMDENGNPKGIGLSCWRFNIGSGSAEQGAASGLEQEAKRTECFLNSDLNTYDWSKQAGQQWFLRKAVEDYEVENIVGFMNSPPVYFTRNGKAYNSDKNWNYNLKDEHYDDYANFTAEVLAHFDEEGLHFDYLSPLNEPQYEWTGGQEGTPANDTQIANVVKAMSTAFNNRGLTTQIFVGEAGSHDKAIPQIPKFWGNSNASLKIAGLPNVANVVASHSYWNDGSATSMVNARTSLKAAVDAVEGLEFFQTEYSLLDAGYGWGHPGGTAGSFTEIECAMSLARMIHVDMVVANATAWHWWTALEQSSHYGEARFCLIEAPTTKDQTDGMFNDTKLLYTLGNYSRFVRPGMKRVGVKRSDNASETDALAAQMYSAYINETDSQIVVVAVNSTLTKSTIKISATNLPVDTGVVFIPYVTSADYNMRAYPQVAAGEPFVLPPLSVVTFVSKFSDEGGIVTPPECDCDCEDEGCDCEECQNIGVDEVEEAIFSVYPNPVLDEVTISGNTGIKKITIYDLYGKTVSQSTYNNENTAQLSLKEAVNGIYVLNIETEQGIITHKIVKK